MNLMRTLAAGLSSIAAGMASLIDSFVGKPRHSQNVADRYLNEAHQAVARNKLPIRSWNEMGNWHQGDWKWPQEQKHSRPTDE
ncbi:hypothetical protein HNP46_006052 [Pseudomonas nitritireducens]|uniref:Uncharacterized protein n=1 Tax=Pseudomonas nitroreducens TaxID=46680 RepID=A0A7W7P3X6_PSENT|nr:hypothetical protein [Pseudomonas nitritireducens]MBB4867141.1 hypothetical protein [Pseudomonas nitritireducens]